MRGMLWALALFFGSGLLGFKALGQAGSVNQQSVSVAAVDYGDEAVAGSTYVPIDSWIYPALDRLQAKDGGADFEVVAINVDTARLERAPAFLNEIGVKNLTRYADPSADAFEALRLAGKALGLPTSLLIDKDGCEVGVVAGPANWDKPDAVAAVAALKGG